MEKSMKCSECGKFCKPYDRGVPFGGESDLDPPDDDFYCEKCARYLENYYCEKKWVPDYWTRPRWSIRAAKKIGLILISPKGASWSCWHNKSKPLPEGYVVV